MVVSFTSGAAGEEVHGQHAGTGDGGLREVHDRWGAGSNARIDPMPRASTGASAQALAEAMAAGSWS
jgi:hypothetical protein